MCKFDNGDTVQDITNNHIHRVGGFKETFVAGARVVEYYLLTEGPDGGYWVSEEDLRYADATLPLHYHGNTLGFAACSGVIHAKSIPSDGSDGKYYDRTIPQKYLDKWNETKTISAEDLILILFDNDFNFGNSFKSLVRANSFVRGFGKQGNTLEYECNKVHYYTDKIEEQGEV